MNRTLTSLVLTVCCLLYLPLATLAVELLQNPGFESGTSQWSGISSDTTVFHTGVKSGRINQTFYWRMVSQTVECEPGQLMSYGGYLKSEDMVVNSGGMRVSFYDSGDQFISSAGAGDVTGTQEWTYVTNSVVVPVTADYAKIQLYVSQSNSTYGKVYFDDLFCDVFSHKEVTVNTNGGFESGYTGWYKGHTSLSSNAAEGVNASAMSHGSYWKQSWYEFSCDPAKEYAVSFWAASDNATSSGLFQIRYYDATDSQISSHHLLSLTDTHSYALYYLDGIYPPVGAEYARFYFAASYPGTGTTYLDDLQITTDADTPEEGVLVFDVTDFSDYSGQSTTGSMSLEAGNTALHLTGNFWRKYAYAYEVTPNTMLEVTVEASNVGELICIGMDSDNDYATSLTNIQFAGSQSHSSFLPLETSYVAGSGSETFILPIGTVFTGNMSYLTFIGDDDLDANVDVTFSNIRIFEAEETELVSSSFIDQALTNLTPDPGMESGVSDWNGGVSLETSIVASGSQAVKIGGASFYKTYSHDLIPVTEGSYYRLFIQAAIESVSVSPTVSFSFYAADGTTRLGTTPTVIDIEGSAPYREFSSLYYLAPAGSAYAKIGVSFPKNNSGAKLYLDDVHLLESSNLPVRLVPTYGAISVYVSREAQVADEVAHVFYREAGTSQWYEAYAPEFDDVRGEYRSSIVGLNEDTAYEVQVVLEANGVPFDEAGASITTWDSEPNIGQTISVASLYSGGQLLIEDLHGEPDAWIKITGTGLNDIDGTYAYDVALKILNSSYLIFEGLDIQGGRRHAVQVQMSDQIRIVNCEMSGWAREANYVSGAYSYETLADMNGGNNRAINKDAGVYLHESSRVTVERCYMHDPRSSANNWEGNNHPAGPCAIYVHNITNTYNIITKGHYVVRYNDLIGSDEIRWNDVIEGENNGSGRGSFYRDSDVYGNMLAFANDDSTEMDGGQMNTRFFGNRIESCFVGLSLAPCTIGPSYVFQNLIYNQGDDRDTNFGMVKLAGGSTYSKGKSFFFHNTIHGRGNGIVGMGFGSDTNKAMFLAQTRNNIIHTTHSHSNYNQTIRDSEQNPWNSFDYDNLSTLGQATANVTYAAGQEPNGILNDPPTFVNVAAGDFRLASGSSGIDDGLPLFNFADQYLGSAPDQGAIEYTDSSLFPIRPIAITADKYFVELSGTAGGSTTPVDVVLSTGVLGSALDYEIRMNNTVDWLSVSPAAGTLNSNSSHTLTLTLQTAGLVSGDKLEATILVKLENGFSVPITVNAEAL
ncbi:right-handed parallel beta-helix repeat-containing protein [Kiritimatiellota bacterium B12222]|nr:right-handed parallel beta-helix repeat-containing protein [Kiritimatiellota bacterium B12222]